MLVRSKLLSISHLDLDAYTVNGDGVTFENKQCQLLVHKLLHTIRNIICDDYVNNNETIFNSPICYMNALYDTETCDIKQLILEIDVEEVNDVICEELGYLFSTENIYINYNIDAVTIEKLDLKCENWREYENTIN